MGKNSAWFAEKVLLGIPGKVLGSNATSCGATISSDAMVSLILLHWLFIATGDRAGILAG